MNILILNGSPLVDGKISTIIKAAIAETFDKDTVNHFNLYDLNIRPCVGCLSCRKSGECVLPDDDAHMLAEKFRMADMVIIGTPTYWANMSGVLKNMFDRLVYVLVKEDGKHGRLSPLMSGRKAVIVASCSAPSIYNIFVPQSKGAVKSIKQILKPAGYNITSIEITGTKHMKKLPNKYASKMAKAMQIR